MENQDETDLAGAKFWRLPEVKRYTKLSEASIRRHLPKPIKLGRTSVWVVAEVKDFCDARIAESRGTAP